METEFVLSLGEQRWTLPAGADTITLGRASNADIRLQADDQISRIHARLTREGTNWTLHDESRNGTGLNGHRLTGPTALTSGDRIHIGRSVLTFHKSTTPDAPAPPATTPSFAPLAPTPAPPPTAPTPPATSTHRADSAAALPPEQASTPPAAQDQPHSAPAATSRAQHAAQPSTAQAFPDGPLDTPDAPGHQPSAASPAPWDDSAIAAHSQSQAPAGATAFPTPPAAPDARDEPPSTARTFAADTASAPDVRRDHRPGTAPAYPADALSPSADARREQPPGATPTYQADALSSSADVRRDQPSAGGTFRSDSADPRGQGQAPAGAAPASAAPVATGVPSNADAPPNHTSSPFAPNHRAPADTSPFAQDDRGSEGANPFAPDGRAHSGGSPFAADDRAADEANPFASDDRASDAVNPFAPDDRAPGGSSPFAPDDRAHSGGSPLAPDDRASDGANLFAPDDRASASASPFAPDDRAPAGGTPFAPDDLAPPGGNPFAADDRGVGDADPVVSGGRDDGEYGAAGFVPGFEGGDGAGRSGNAGAWAAYPSADSPEPVRSPWEVSAQVDRSEPNWNESDSWPDPSVATTDRSTGAERTPGDHRSTKDRRSPAADRRAAKLPGTTDPDEAVGTVRLGRVLIAAGGVIGLGLIVNLIVTFLADGPGSALRWLIPPVIALVVAMALALTDAATTKHHRRGPLDVSVLVAIAVVLVGVGVGGFALTAGTEYVAGYLTGNESGEDRLIKPVAKTGTGITVTVENVTYTGHFTRIEVTVANAAKQPVTIPLDGTTFTAADGTALRADTGRSSWPSAIPAGGSEHGTITFKGHLPDSATAAVLTFKSGDTTFSVPGVTLSR